MRNLIAALRMLALASGTVLLFPAHLLVWGTTGSLRVAPYWHRMACRIFNIRVRFVGTPASGDDRPVVFLSNHVSYLDIVILGAYLDAIFVAKSEVASWPIFGFLARTRRTVFIERRRAALDASQRKIAAVLRGGDNIVLFAEGTSTDGRDVKPFKPALLELLFSDAVPALLQPVSIVLERAGGRPVEAQAVRDLYAWWRLETTLAPHLWAFARAGGAELTIHCGEPLDPAAFHDRKALAQAAHKAVLSPVAAARPDTV